MDPCGPQLKTTAQNVVSASVPILLKPLRIDKYQDIKYLLYICLVQDEPTQVSLKCHNLLTGNGDRSLKQEHSSIEHQ